MWITKKKQEFIESEFRRFKERLDDQEETNSKLRKEIDQLHKASTSGGPDRMASIFDRIRYENSLLSKDSSYTAIEAVNAIAAHLKLDLRKTQAEPSKLVVKPIPAKRK